MSANEKQITELASWQNKQWNYAPSQGTVLAKWIYEREQAKRLLESLEAVKK